MNFIEQDSDDLAVIVHPEVKTSKLYNPKPKQESRMPCNPSSLRFHDLSQLCSNCTES